MENSNLIKKINEVINNHVEINLSFGNFWRKLRSLGNFYIVGGAIRSIYKDREPRDIDIIVKDSVENVLSALSNNVSISKNYFGGYKINFTGIIVDIWDFESHWAFKSGLLSPEEKNLAESCFFDFDALVYSPANNYLNIDHFRHSIESNTIDFIKNDETYIKSNPGNLTNVLRAIIAASDFNLKFSSAVTSYIKSFLEKNNFTSLKECEKRHYREEKLSCDQYESFLQAIGLNGGTHYLPAHAASARP